MPDPKPITEFLFENTQGHFSYDKYAIEPATAFLAYAVSAKDAIEYCKTHFPHKEDTDHLTQPSIIAIQHIINSTLASVMGHFETFQKHLFAGLFDRTVYIQEFDPNSFFRQLDKKDGVDVQLIHLLAYRDTKTHTGILIADCLSGWHNPECVNKYFYAFGFKTQFFDNDALLDLKQLWQLRHSIVHTAGTLTRPDAQKVLTLYEMGNRNIVFSNKFMYEIVKRLHSLVYQSVVRLRNTFEPRINNTLSTKDKKELLQFFNVNSKQKSWLK